jgi:hypothetical protein
MSRWNEENKVKAEQRTKANVNGVKDHDQRIAARGGKCHRLEKNHRLPPYECLGGM